MYIYKITNVINGKFYIGKCKRDVESSAKYFGSGKILQNAINKYGLDNFVKEILFETDDNDLLNIKEKEYIKLLGACNRSIAYNIAKGGEGGDTISNYPEKARIAENYSIWSKQFWTDDNKNKRSENYTGAGNPFANKNHSELSKKQISEKKKGISMSEDTKDRISFTLKEKYASGEIVKIVSEECRIKLSKSHLGKRHTQEACNKISHSMSAEKNPSAKNWCFIHKDGTEVKVKGEFRKFCEDHKLSHKVMRNIAYGIRKDKFYNDWTVRRDDESC